MTAAPGPVYEAIRRRRVTRQMSQNRSTRASSSLIIRAARYAPNAGNRRLQPVISVTDPRTLRMLRLVSPGMLPQPTAAAVICIDEGRAAGYGFRPGTPGLYIDVGTTAATMLLAAFELGVACCPVTSFSRAAVARILGMDDAVKPQMIICLGRAGAHQPPAMGARWAARSNPGEPAVGGGAVPPGRHDRSRLERQYLVGDR